MNTLIPTINTISTTLKNDFFFILSSLLNFSLNDKQLAYRLRNLGETVADIGILIGHEPGCDERPHPDNQHDFEHIEKRFLFHKNLLVNFFG